MSLNVVKLADKDDMERNKALDAALSQIERAFGKGSIMRLGQRETAVEAEAISTGSLGLDIALGIGGLPRGRVIEIYGPESSGKTTLALHVIAEAQRSGGACAFIDAEHALDPSYATKLGVNIDDLLISQPDAGEQALEIADTLVRSGAIDVLVVDSVAALVPKAELEGEMGDTHVGLQARLMSQALRKLTGSISRSRCMVIFSVVEFDVMYGEGISKTGELIDLGVAASVVEKSGAWFSYNGQRIGQGRENAKAFLKENTQVANEIEQKIRSNAGLVAGAMMDKGGAAEDSAGE
jgi:recombination protein RecA